MKDSKRKVSYIKVCAGSIVNCWHAHPPLFIALMIISALLCAIEIGEVYAMRYLFDAVTSYIEGNLLINGVAVASIPMAAVLIAGPFVKIFEWLLQGYFWRRGSGYLMARYHDRIKHIPLIDFEKHETFNQMKKAQIGSEDAPSASRSIIQFSFHYIPYLIFISIFIFSIKPLLLVLLFAIFISIIFSQIVRAGIIYRFEENNVGNRRQMEYLESCITGKEYVKETRTLGATRYFMKLFMDSMKQFNKVTMKTEKKIAYIELLLRFINVLSYIGILVLLVYYLINDIISVGAFASVFYSVERINGVLKNMVDQFGDALKEMSTASFTHEFLYIDKEEGNKAMLDKNVDIYLDNVSFNYPGCNEAVLKDITITLKQGETLAIVGENGAGKTTLTKILIGLYPPTSGSIYYGDKDIIKYAAKSRFENVSSVFQSFIRYKLTAKENISISDTDVEGMEEMAAHEAGVQLKHLLNGLDTMLSREFDGIELSGGQWQRIAIARGLYRKHNIIVLDEPTAAIDPIEESNIFQLFKESAKEKTAILVTHRLGSTKIADRILLLEDGKICELGTHEQLMALKGRYAHMYSEQASWYVR